MRTRLSTNGLTALLTLATFSGWAWAQPAQFQVNGIPDFSQHQNPAWRNYCAPTAGADVIYTGSPLPTRRCGEAARTGPALRPTTA